jgi:peroxiredoxin Q/BCP
VLGVSPDSLDTHNKFSEQYKFTFPLLSDTDGKMRALYGSKRITYLIDMKGIIRYIQEGIPKNKDFLKELKKLGEGK